MGLNGNTVLPGPAVTAASPGGSMASAILPTQTNHSTELIVLPRDTEVAKLFMPIMAIEQAKARRDAIVHLMQNAMIAGVDYGHPWSDKPGERPSLLQPGADKLASYFGLVVRYSQTKCTEDWTGERHGGIPFFFYEISGSAYRGDSLIGEGVGSCNSWESKYKYRTMERTCPHCGKANIRKSKRPGEGWYCWVKTDGCGATFEEDDPAIVGQEVGRKLNPDPADVVNTVLKIAYKRCKISTTINATSASEFFSQDAEDFDVDPDPQGKTIDTGGHPHGTREAAQHVAETKIAAMKSGKKPVPLPPELTATRSGEIKQAFAVLREHLGETVYLRELELAGSKNVLDLELGKIRALYKRLLALAQSEVA